VIGTDGIWDNLKDQMIFQIIEDKTMTLEKKA